MLVAFLFGRFFALVNMYHYNKKTSKRQNRKELTDGERSQKHKMNIEPKTIKCPICGKENETYEVLSHIVFSHDLDGRANPGVIGYNVNECPECGYIYRLLDNNREKGSDVVSRWNEIKEKYGFYKPAICKSGIYYRIYLIEYYEYSEQKSAFYTIRNASWMADDENDFLNAKRYRGLALELVDQLIDDTEREKGKEQLELMRVDFLRRNSSFEAAQKYAEKMIGSSIDIHSRIARFQCYLCKEQDWGIYRTGDARRFTETEDRKDDVLRKIAGLYKEEEIVDAVNQILSKSENDRKIFELISISIDRNKPDSQRILNSLEALGRLEVIKDGEDN